jgi:hypothetical protein
MVAALLFCTTAASAVSSSLWEVKTKEGFEDGEPDGVSIMPPGAVTLGPEAKTTTLDALFVWALAEDSKGRVYAGTGAEGRIYRVLPDGASELFADLNLQQVFALAIDKKDTLYAAGFPQGKIYSINDKGEVSEYYDTLQDAVWSLFLASDGALFAGTGGEGRIFKIEAKDKGAVLYDSPERRILSLAGDPKGNLFAGSEPNGIIYSIDPKGQLSVLYDTELEEITSMSADAEGNLYAVSAPGELFMKMPLPHEGPPALPKPEQPMPQAAPTQPSAPMPGLPVMPSPKKRTCIIYKVGPQGTASKFWTSPEQLIFSVLFNGNNILAGSGDEGIIYAITLNGESGTYYKADQKQVLDLFKSKHGAIIASTGNDAGIVRLGKHLASEGTLVSQVHDTTAISKWGRVFWEAELPANTHLSLAIRTGNSETPDDTWTDWSPEQTKDFLPESPDARYIQWRATLGTLDLNKTPVLRKTTVAYLQRNLAPVVESVTVGGEPAEKKANDGTTDAAKAMKALAAAGEKPAEKSTTDGVKSAPPAHETKLKIQWKATDQNGDTLEYGIYFRGVEEIRWKLLEEDLTEAKYELDTSSVPDGEYRLKIVATDAPSNPENVALTDERMSDSFIIDNTSPVVKPIGAVAGGRSRSYQITFTISDNLAPVRSAEYSIDAGDWTPVLPQDGIFDSPSEHVVFATDELDEGEHTVVLKAVDYYGNIGAGKTTFVVK